MPKQRFGRIDQAVDKVDGAVKALAPSWVGQPRPHGGAAGPADPEPDYGDNAEGEPITGQEFMFPGDREPAAPFPPQPAPVVVIEQTKPLPTREALPGRWTPRTITLQAQTATLVAGANPDRARVYVAVDDSVTTVRVGASESEVSETGTSVDARMVPPLDHTAEVWAWATSGTPDIEVIETMRDHGWRA